MYSPLLAVLSAMLGGVDGADLVETAEDYIGYPYVYGDEGTYGFDCSGFVRTVYARHGYRLPRTSKVQSKVGEPVPFEALQAGDLVFFTPSPGSNRVSHVGIATGDGSMIHASSGRGEVVRDPLTMRYWQLHKAEGRRVLGTPFSEIARDVNEPDREHIEPVPSTLGSSAKPGLWHRGPINLARGHSAIGVRSLVAAGDDEATLWLISPTLRLRSDTHDAELQLQLPIAWDSDGDRRLLLEGNNGALRALEHIRVGSPDADLYLEASRSVSLSFGELSLLDGVTPTASGATLVGFPDRAAVAVSAAGRLPQVAIAAAIDDVLAPSVVASRIETNGELKVSGELLVDPNAPDGSRVVGGVSLAYDLLDRRRVGIQVHGRGGAFETEEVSLSLSAGASLRWSPSPIEVQIHADWRRFQHGAAPDLFGIDYRAQRNRGIWSALDRESLSDGWQESTRLEALVALTRRFALRLGTTLADTEEGFVPQSQYEVGLIAREWRLARSTTASAAISYHQRFVEELESIGDDVPSELFFATARVHHLSGLSFGAQLAKRPRADESRIDTALDVAYAFEF